MTYIGKECNRCNINKEDSGEGYYYSHSIETCIQNLKKQIKDPDRIHIVFSNVMGSKVTAGVFVNPVEAEKLKKELNQYLFTWIVNIKQGVPLLRWNEDTKKPEFT